MAKYRVTAPDGASFEITAPDDATPDQVQAFAQQQFKTMKPAAPAGRAADGGIVGGIKQGLRDPIDAGAQMLRRIVPEPVAQAVDAAGNWLADKGLPVARSSGVAGVDKLVRESGQQYEADRAAAGRSGLDGARLAGNVVNPVNLAMPSAAGAGTVRALAARGAIAGGASAALQPVVEGQGDFWGSKAGQVAVGAATGGILTPAISKGVEKVGAALAQRAADRAPTTVILGGAPALTRADLDAAVGRLLQSQGMRLDEAPKVMLDSVRRQLAESLAGGRRLDPAAALRLAEAEALGLTGDAALTLGQATRDPMRWAQERNLSGIVINTPRGPTNPMADRFTAQNRALGRLFSGADDAADRVTAGEQLLGAAQAANKRADSSVRAAYDAFRNATGRDLEVPLQGLAQDYATTLETFGDAVPAAVRKQFEALGLMGGTQRRGLTIDGAERLIKVLNANTDPANKPAFRALGELRGAVERAITGAADNAPTGAGAEAAMLAKEARSTAAGVFQTRRDIPALKAAMDDAAPDRFVQRHIIGAPTREVDGLLAVLRDDPAAMQQARSQVMRYLQRAAFGENLAGDAPFAADRYAKALEQIGPQKLRTMFGDDAVPLTLAGRVAAQINSAPVGAKNAVNNSGTGAALFNLLQRIAESPVARNIPGIRGLSNQVGEIANERAIQQALATPQASSKPAAELSPEARRAIGRLFTPAALALGSSSGSGY